MSARTLARILACPTCLALGALAPAAQQLLFQVPGQQTPFGTSSDFGQAVSGGRDVDGDLLPDLAIGAPRMSGGGLLRVVSGVDGHALFAELTGAGTQGYLGFSVALVGDTDGDARADLLAGGPELGNLGLDGQGFARLYDSQGAQRLHWDGLHDSDYFGSAVAELGDLDGDGAPELAVGANQSMSNVSGNGYVSVFSGASGALLKRHIGSSIGAFGSSIASVGDLDGDGLAEYAVGSPGAGNVQGVVHVFSGATLTQKWKKAGGPLSGRYGWAVSGWGDLDLDGVPELLVGAPGGNGLFEVVSGASGQALIAIPPVQGNAFFGGALAALGDIDGDGRPDAAVGAKWAGVAGIQLCGATWILSGNGGILGLAHGGAPYDAFGISLAAAGDLDGDGFAEIASGATQQSSNGAGYARALTTRPKLIGSPPAISVASGGTQSWSLDASPASANLLYVIAGSLTDQLPGTALGGLLIPLDWDAYTAWTLSAPNTPPLSGSLGLLDGNGRATGSFTLPAGSSSALAGLAAWHAFVSIELATGALVEASNAVRLELIP